MFKTLIQKAVRSRSNTVFNRIKPYINKNEKLLDIGSGSGDVSFVLKQNDYNVTPLDVVDFHGPRLIETTIYDGKNIPFANNSFDKALLLMVMHHTPDPELILNEGLRVAKELIVIETSYVTKFERFYTIVTDTIGNLRFDAFWNSYKTDYEWKQLFNAKNLTVSDTHIFHDHNLGFPQLHISYHLIRK
ncbi:SAM-dependent methyltransferase [Candidatus Dojkabacteria bacterium CG_4_9_14_3_um_filter_150_Dojkabacteria_WS6_41_13]|uniref:SAM-dependent methyltransferase n=1 Tax=Candidatus Dojkabacteria bacterium CG_4_10_14_0_2_um_filter_Dojkabacteria_WS6_41_15 TaxID=2014249 RepID=A0A2M7W0V3_9BACT|nr:MAG: SAM-dependent methyltransferase [Candidatus Dojkabacteria bacterium CG_4_10_14_0_2_um_filter_Dojkabacteria_WS6_41_15]PJB23347.1 MAG: SAM-dependent methyltransferase [Candidatus Dojkabacteria bacterium CG_4_9_14_3_um_filter_150_Dojkabacteria_WS6_41_13]